MNGIYRDRGPCRECGQLALPGPGQGIDPCLGLLPGVSNACCGHGDVEKAYVVIGGRPGQGSAQLPDRVTLYGPDALVYFAEVLAA